MPTRAHLGADGPDVLEGREQAACFEIFCSRLLAKAAGRHEKAFVGNALHAAHNGPEAKACNTTWLQRCKRRRARQPTGKIWLPGKM